MNVLNEIFKKINVCRRLLCVSFCSIKENVIKCFKKGKVLGGC